MLRSIDKGYPPIQSLALKMFLQMRIQITSMSQFRLHWCIGRNIFDIFGRRLAYGAKCSTCALEGQKKKPTKTDRKTST